MRMGNGWSTVDDFEYHFLRRVRPQTSILRLGVSHLAPHRAIPPIFDCLLLLCYLHLIDKYILAHVRPHQAYRTTRITIIRDSVSVFPRVLGRA